MRDVQHASAGDSMPEIHLAALQAARPEMGLSWIDIGCGRGDVLRLVRDRWGPSHLAGSDLLDWLAPDLRADVSLSLGPAEGLRPQRQYDRVLLVETLEHLEAPWSVLRAAAGMVAGGGRIVTTTPNIASLRHRIEMPIRGSLTSFRHDHTPHLSPILPHVTSRILTEEGLRPEEPRFAAADMLPGVPNVSWPGRLVRRFPSLLSLSVVIAATAKPFAHLPAKVA